MSFLFYFIALRMSLLSVQNVLTASKKVRCIFLDFKHIIFHVQILIEVSDIKFHENPSGMIHVNIRGQITRTHPQH